MPEDYGGGVDFTPRELSRQVHDVLSRFESLIRQVEERYVRKDILDLYKESVNTAVKGAQDRLDALGRDKADKTEVTELKKRVSDLEDTNKWLFRLVIAFIVVGVLGAVFVTGGGTP